MSIRDWPASERPREKLLHRGAQALSDAELLVIFLRSGSCGLSAVELAREVIRVHGGLRPLLLADVDSFCAIRGLGPAKFAQLQAALELVRRHLGEALLRRDVMKNPRETEAYLIARLRDQRREVFACLFLDSGHRVIAYEELFRGTIDSAAVHPREVIRCALKHNAAALILAHNHPSGIAEPSEADRRITLRIKQALALMDIRLLDHFVVGDGHAVSFSQRGIL